MAARIEAGHAPAIGQVGHADSLEHGMRGDEMDLQVLQIALRQRREGLKLGQHRPGDVAVEDQRSALVEIGLDHRRDLAQVALVQMRRQQQRRIPRQRRLVQRVMVDLVGVLDEPGHARQVAAGALDRLEEQAAAHARTLLLGLA